LFVDEFEKAIANGNGLQSRLEKQAFQVIKKEVGENEDSRNISQRVAIPPRKAGISRRRCKMSYAFMKVEYVAIPPRKAGISRMITT